MKPGYLPLAAAICAIADRGNPETFGPLGVPGACAKAHALDFESLTSLVLRMLFAWLAAVLWSAS
jgi:hypothetical protein